MIVFPNAKINIGLNVIRKRDDGFHDIETIFYPIPFSDILEAILIDSDKNNIYISFSGINIDCDCSSNLVFKAYNLLRNFFDLPSLKVHLHKIIPPGSGLGGGSSNASFMLKIINHFIFDKLTELQLLEYASLLGSDCPFFIKNAPCFATGKGEIMENIDLDLSDYYIVIVIPKVIINTGKAYGAIKIGEKKENTLKELINLPIEEWKFYISNDFEKIVFEWYPELKKIKEELYNIGAIYSSLSGSGSSIYGIFKEKPILSEFLKKFFIWSGYLRFY